MNQESLCLSGMGSVNKNIFDMVLSTELDPYKALVGVLDSGRYDCVKGIIDDSVTHE